MKSSKYYDSCYFSMKINEWSMIFGSKINSKSVNKRHARWNVSFLPPLEEPQRPTVRRLAEDHARRSPDPEIAKIRMNLLRSPGFHPWTQDRRGTLKSEKIICPIWKGSCETKVPRSPGYPSLSKLRFFQDR